MTGNNAELPRFLVGVIDFHRIVKRQVVSSKAAAHHGSVRCEDSSHRNLRILKIKEAGTSLPLMELSHDFISRRQIEIVETLNHMAGSVTEKHILLVVPVSGDGIHSEPLPVLSENVVLPSEILFEIHQNGYRTAGNIPPSDTDT